MPLSRAGFSAACGVAPANEPSDQVEIKVSRGTVTILTRRLAARDLDDTLTTEEAKKVRHAMKQVREGKVTAWSKVKHELGL